jgi:hypothetical protein
VDSTPTQPVASSLAREAEGLLRSLEGVAHARVIVGHRGIDAIHVVAADHAVAPTLAARVRSALLAGLATPILPARIHVRVEDAAPGHGDEPAVVEQTHRVRVVDTIEPRDADRPPPPTDGEVGAPRRAPRAGEHLTTAGPRLVAVDLERRDDGRILCRVSIAFRTRVHSDQALAVDLPGAAAHAAAQAAVRALVQAGIDGLELDGLRDVEIAGRNYALVALRRVDTSRRVRSGSAPIMGSAERAAALATIMAAQELL